ncbi:hypothetical protein N5D31_17350 [Pseudomonas sp. GD03867]|uniref:putative adhesin n=2 Tax=unclassified Pseudomonas TaxID=196821 RepID=UPI00244D5F29|nr:hypothetical protein [Pseudomonas sp. GD03867]MDH0648574.1 hypothetical protein [Pseudomonas sp. GD03867]
MITTSKDDLILVGHGTYLGGADTFVLPAGVELHITQPVGSALTVGAAGVLLANKAVDRAVLVQPSKQFDDFATLGLGSGTVYKPGERAPNLLLHDLGTLKPALQKLATQGASHVVYVGADTLLADVLAKDPTVKPLIAAAVQAKKVLKVYWAACTALEQNPDAAPVVWFNGLAVANAALSHAAATPTDKTAEQAAQAANTYAQAHYLDSQGTIAAAAKFNTTVANLLKAL